MRCYKSILLAGVSIICLGIATDSLAAPTDSNLKKQVRNLKKRVAAVETIQSKALSECHLLPFQERFNRGRPGSVLELKVECPNAAGNMISGGYEVFQDLDPLGATPAIGTLIVSNVLRQKYTDRNNDGTPDTYNLAVTAGENFWVDVDVYCCQ